MANSGVGGIGARRSLLAIRGQSASVEGFENLRSRAVGIGQGQSCSKGVAVAGEEMD